MLYFSHACNKNTMTTIDMQKYKDTENFKYEELHMYSRGGKGE